MSATLIAPGQVALPHGNGFRFVHRIVERSDNGVTTEYDYKGNEELRLADHFPGQPIFPGVLLLEAMAQSAIQIVIHKPEYDNVLPVFRGVEEYKIKAVIDPPATIRFTAEIIFIKLGMGKVSCAAILNGKQIASATIVFALLRK